MKYALTELFGHWFFRFTCDYTSVEEVAARDEVREWLGERGAAITGRRWNQSRLTTDEAQVSDDLAFEIRMRWPCTVNRRGGW